MNKLLHKINCKYSHLSLVIIFFFFSTHSSAKMPLTAFKSLSRVFHEQTRLYSPALGLPALESGLLENLRFFNIIAAYNEDGSRSYAQDTPFNQDAMASLVLKLFPSTGGQLSTISLHPANFGRYVKDPKSVALLLNFAFAVEKGVADKNLVIEEILDSLIFESQKTSYTIAQDTMQRGLLDIQNLEKSFSSQSFQTSFLMEALRDLSNQLPKNYASRLKPVVEAKSLVGNKNPNAKLWARITQKINMTIDTEYKSSIKKLQKHLRPTIFSLLEAIELSIIQSHSFYPKGTTQQLINAFFCQHFNSRAEIKELLNSLDPQIVDPLRVARFSIADTIQEGDAALIAKNNYYDYDDIIALLTPDIFTNPIPYREGTALLSNESAHPYNRAKDQIIYNIDFADCTEMALRHIINLLIFDDKKKEFSLSHIKDQENNPYFNNLKYFYHKYGLESANAGDIKTRSAWNKVVGDLNFGSDSDDVAYIENTYNLDGGFENTIRVFEKLLGLRFDKPSNPKSKKEWIINCFTTIFTKFNPKNYYDIQLIKDTLSVQVNNNKNTPLFSFDYYSSSQVHAQIQNLKIDLKSESRSSVKIPITRGTTEESLLLLENNKLPQNSPSHLLYTIMPKISGHTLIEKISKIHPNESVNNDTDRTLQNILKTALNQFNWDDLHTITTHVEKFLLLSKHPLFHEVISLNCRHIVIPVESYLPQNSNSHDVLRQLSEFSGLERLTINNDEL